VSSLDFVQHGDSLTVGMHIRSVQRIFGCARLRKRKVAFRTLASPLLHKVSLPKPAGGRMCFDIKAVLQALEKASLSRARCGLIPAPGSFAAPAFAVGVRGGGKIGPRVDPHGQRLFIRGGQSCVKDGRPTRSNQTSSAIPRCSSVCSGSSQSSERGAKGRRIVRRSWLKTDAQFSRLEQKKERPRKETR